MKATGAPDPRDDLDRQQQARSRVGERSGSFGRRSKPRLPGTLEPKPDETTYYGPKAACRHRLQLADSRQ